MTLLSTVAAWFLSLVFLRALIHKLGRPAEFTGILRQYRLLPNRLVPLAATAVVASEACAAAGLMLPQSRAAAALLACGLLLIYAAAIGTNLLRGRMSIPCGCGGAGQGISRLHVIRNVLLALCAVPATAAASQGPMRFEFSIVTAGSVLAVWFIFLAFDQLLGNRTHALATEYSSF
jgi:uncharacterized membrane protein